MPDDSHETEVESRLEQIQDDIEDIQGDVRVLSTLNKELNKEELVNVILASIGSSGSKAEAWYFADGSRTTREIADLSDNSYSAIRGALTDLSKSGIVVKHEKGRQTIYDKAEVSTNLGIEGKLEDKFDL